MLNKTVISSFMIIVMVALIGWIVFLVAGQRAEKVPIEATYEGKKVVYSYDLSTPRAPLEEHCSALGGTLNDCGSPCAPDAEACIAVCALTCDIAKPTVDTEAVLKVGQTKSIETVSITLLDIVQDSRCPIDVTCIRAGDVTVKLRLASGTEKKDVTMTSEASTTFAGATLAIESVTPAPRAGISIADSAYEITVSVRR